MATTAVVVTMGPATVEAITADTASLDADPLTADGEGTQVEASTTRKASMAEEAFTAEEALTAEEDTEVGAGKSAREFERPAVQTAGLFLREGPDVMAAAERGPREPSRLCSAQFAIATNQKGKMGRSKPPGAMKNCAGCRGVLVANSDVSLLS